MSSKGSVRRPGIGYADGWESIFSAPTAQPCEPCGGSGKIPGDAGPVKCPYCSGTGRDRSGECMPTDDGPGCKCELGDCGAINSRACRDWMKRGGR